jgi:hypothetical protein
VICPQSETRRACPRNLFHISLRLILILSAHQFVGFASWFFLSDSPYLPSKALCMPWQTYFSLLGHSSYIRNKNHEASASPSWEPSICSEVEKFRAFMTPKTSLRAATGQINSAHTPKTPCLEYASELYRPSDRRLSAKLMSTFADRGCCMVSVTDPYGRNLDFLDRSRYFFFQVAPQLYSRGWVDPLLLRKYGSSGNRTRTCGSVARSSDH